MQIWQTASILGPLFISATSEANGNFKLGKKLGSGEQHVNIKKIGTRLFLKPMKVKTVLCGMQLG